MNEQGNKEYGVSVRQRGQYVLYLCVLQLDNDII